MLLIFWCNNKNFRFVKIITSQVLIFNIKVNVPIIPNVTRSSPITYKTFIRFSRCIPTHVFTSNILFLLIKKYLYLKHNSMNLKAFFYPLHYFFNMNVYFQLKAPNAVRYLKFKLNKLFKLSETRIKVQFLICKTKFFETISAFIHKFSGDLEIRNYSYRI